MADLNLLKAKSGSLGSFKSFFVELNIKEMIKEKGATATEIATSDTIEVMKFAGKALVKNLNLIVVKKGESGGSCTISIGDGTDVDAWIKAGNAIADAGTIYGMDGKFVLEQSNSASYEVDLKPAKLVKADDKISATIGTTAITDGIFLLTGEILDIDGLA